MAQRSLRFGGVRGEHTDAEAATAMTSVTTDGKGRPAPRQPSVATGGAREPEGVMTSKADARRFASSESGIQIGALERRTRPAGRGFGVTAVASDTTDESKQHSGDRDRQRLTSAAPRVRGDDDANGDEKRMRRRGRTQRHRNRALGGRRQDRLLEGMRAFEFVPAAAYDESNREPQPATAGGNTGGVSGRGPIYQSYRGDTLWVWYDRRVPASDPFQ